MTKVLGQHTLRAGVFYQWDNNPQLPPFVNSNGTINIYYVGDQFTDRVRGVVHTTGVTGTGNGGNYLADVAEGIVGGYSQNNIQPEANLYFWNLAGYAQDHWRVNPHLTLDLGVRLEHSTPWQDAHNVGLATFTAAAYDAGTNPTLPGVQWHAQNNAIPNGGRPTRWAFVNPRAGFAYDPTSRGATVVRGGFGIYTAHDAYNNASNQNTTVLGSRSFSITSPVLLSSVSAYRSDATNANGFVPDTSIYAFNPKDDLEPRVFTWNLAVDQKMPGGMLLEVAYVGNYSDHLLNDGSTQNTTLDDLNSLPVGSLFKPQPNTRGFAAGTVYPVFGPGVSQRRAKHQRGRS